MIIIFIFLTLNLHRGFVPWAVFVLLFCIILLYLPLLAKINLCDIQFWLQWAILLLLFLGWLVNTLIFFSINFLFINLEDLSSKLNIFLLNIKTFWKLARTTSERLFYAGCGSSNSNYILQPDWTWLLKVMNSYKSS